MKRTYVIAGLGFSAILNHITLRATGALDGYDVIHIGREDLWRTYDRASEMGQHSILLQMPGLPDFIGSGAYCTSGSFAAALRQGLEQIEKSAEIRHEHIDEIRPDGDGFLIRLPNETIRADRVDVCVGRGPARKWPRSLSDELAAEYNSPNPSHIFTGEQFLATPHRKSSGTVCIVGDGPVSSWCVERALPHYAHVYWFAFRDERLEGLFGAGAFPPSGRNDRLLQPGSIRREFLKSRGPQWYTFRIENHGDWQPASEKLTLIESAYIQSVGFADGKISIKLDERSYKIDSSMRLLRAVQQGPTSLLAADIDRLLFDKIVFALGQQTDPADDASVAALLRYVIPRNTDADDADREGPPTHDLRPYLLRSPTQPKRLLGLKSANANLRVLGASSAVHPVLAKEHIVDTSTPVTTERHACLYYNTLCCEGKQKDLIPAIIWSICEANGYDISRLATPVLTNLAPHDYLSDFSEEWVEQRARSTAPI